MVHIYSDGVGHITIGANTAYFIALKRGFLPGYEAADWAAAEKEVDEAYQSSGAFKGELAQ